MAKKEMWDFLNATTANSTYYLTLTHARTITESGGYTGAIRQFDDGREERVAFTTRPTFMISCPIATIRSSSMGDIMDFFFSTAKAHGVYRSFRFLHKDGHPYAVRFANDFTRSLLTEPSSFMSAGDIVLKVLGRATAT